PQATQFGGSGGAKPPLVGGCGGTTPHNKHERAPHVCDLRRQGAPQVKLGGVLLSHTLTSAVPSALEGLASGFGLGPGVSPPLTPPKHYEDNHHTQPTRA